MHFSDLRSPSGKLVQIEYALAAVAAGAPSVGIKGEQSVKEVVVKYKCQCGVNLVKSSFKYCSIKFLSIGSQIRVLIELVII